MNWGSEGSVSIDFSNAELTHNNLGGMGPDYDDPPDTPTLIFSGIGSQGDSVLDLVVSAPNDYSPWATSSNKINGDFGQINLQVSMITPAIRRPHALRLEPSVALTG